MKYLLCFIILTSCAAFTPAPLSPEGQRVRVATAITVYETETYRDLGSLACTEGPLTDCDIDLRNRAGALGAEVIVIESRTASPCGDGTGQSCITVFARAYRRG